MLYLKLPNNVIDCQPRALAFGERIVLKLQLQQQVVGHILLVFALLEIAMVTLYQVHQGVDNCDSHSVLDCVVFTTEEQVEL